MPNHESFDSRFKAEEGRNRQLCLLWKLGHVAIGPVDAFLFDCDAIVKGLVPGRDLETTRALVQNIALAEEDLVDAHHPTEHTRDFRLNPTNENSNRLYYTVERRQ